jgi:preprotein translocase subunit SecG
MQAVLIVIHLLIAIALISAIMLQRSEGGALGMGGGGSGLGGLFSPRGAANTLTRTTVVLGVMFFLTSITLTMMSLGTRQANPLLLPGAPAGPAVPGVPGAPPTLPGLPTAPVAPGAAPGAPAGAAPAPAAPVPALPAPPAPAGVPPAAK